MKLQLTNGYRPRFDQITRILQFLHSQEDRKKIPRQEIVAALGIPDKQVVNLTSMMTGFGLVLPRATLLTLFGKAVIQFDPYFDRLETLWMIHYLVSSNPEYVVWHRIINTVLPSQDQFSIKQVADHFFPDLAIHFSERTISEKLPKEVGAVFAAYTRSKLSYLGIFAAEGVGNFIKSNPVDVPALAFLFCLAHFREQHFPGSSALNIEEICRAENSPGRVLLLSEYQVRSQLGDLHNAGLVRLEQLANLDQVRFTDNLTTEFVLQKIYGGQDAH
ncbi:MAG: DUF4007 family protein [Chloroflexota bacterium]